MSPVKSSPFKIWNPQRLTWKAKVRSYWYICFSPKFLMFLQGVAVAPRKVLMSSKNFKKSWSALSKSGTPSARNGRFVILCAYCVHIKEFLPPAHVVRREVIFSLLCVCFLGGGGYPRLKTGFIVLPEFPPYKVFITWALVSSEPNQWIETDGKLWKPRKSSNFDGGDRK